MAAIPSSLAMEWVQANWADVKSRWLPCMNWISMLPWFGPIGFPVPSPIEVACLWIPILLETLILPICITVMCVFPCTRSCTGIGLLVSWRKVRLVGVLISFSGPPVRGRIPLSVWVGRDRDDSGVVEVGVSGSSRTMVSFVVRA